MCRSGGHQDLCRNSAQRFFFVGLHPTFAVAVSRSDLLPQDPSPSSLLRIRQRLFVPALALNAGFPYGTQRRNL